MKAKTPQSTTKAVLDKDEPYWMAVEIIQDRYKDVSNQDLVRLAEKVTEEEIQLSLSQRDKQKLLSRRRRA
jgi:hypothetical protein